jgi:hypothetical protein
MKVQGGVCTIELDRATISALRAATMHYLLHWRDQKRAAAAAGKTEDARICGVLEEKYRAAFRESGKALMAADGLETLRKAKIL